MPVVIDSIVNSCLFNAQGLLNKEYACYFVKANHQVVLRCMGTETKYVRYVVRGVNSQYRALAIALRNGDKVSIYNIP